jgi:predicted oxidoreductase (fatty acid repression mutant protein)
MRFSAFNAQSSRVIIVVVQVGAVKIYVVAVEALKKKEKTG